MDQFNVYVIHSGNPLSELRAMLEECGGYRYSGIIYRSAKRVVGNRIITIKEETRKTIVFCPQSTVDTFLSTYPDFANCVMDYEWESFPVPLDEHKETWDLHVSGVPNDYTASEAESMVRSMLHPVISSERYKVTFVTRLRETGEIYGFGHLNFAEDVDHETIKLCKIVLHNTPIGFSSPENNQRRMMTCVWKRNMEQTHPRRAMADMYVAPTRIQQRAKLVD